MKILVTGANGLLGQKLTDRYLQGKGSWELLALGRGKNRHPVKSGYHYIDVNLLDAGNLETVLEKYRPDAIVHTAALTNVDACEQQPTLCHQLNVEVVRRLWSWCTRSGAFFLHLSTDFIFDGQKGTLYVEEDKAHPLSIYGQSKWESEQILHHAKEKHWAIARTILVYGVVADMSRSNIALWAKGALEKGDEMRVVTDQFRTPTLAEDLADGCLRIVLNRAQGVFHLSGPEYLSIFDFVKCVGEVFELPVGQVEPVKSEELGQPANRPPKTGFDIAKARSALGYRPHNVREGLAILKEQLLESAPK